MKALLARSPSSLVVVSIIILLIIIGIDDHGFDIFAPNCAQRATRGRIGQEKPPASSPLTSDCRCCLPRICERLAIHFHAPIRVPEDLVAATGSPLWRPEP